MFEVAATINRGIIDHIEARGHGRLVDWKEQVHNVFEVQCETQANKTTATGSLATMQAFQNYLDHEFPKEPHETIDDKRTSLHANDEDRNNDSESEQLIPVVDNSQDGILYAYVINGLEVCIYEGDITNANVECIVSSASSSLSGRTGVEKSIMDMAGDEVKKECLTRVPKGKLSSGDVLVTGAGNLKCKNIIHCVLPRLTKENVHGVLKDAIVQCIGEAEKRGLKTMAMPALGSGNFGADPEVFVNAFYNAIPSVDKKRSTKQIQLVGNRKLVITATDIFKHKFKYLKLNKTTVYVAQGHVTALNADAIVVFQDSNFNNNNSVAKEVASMSGNTYIDRLELFKDQAARIGSVYITNADGDLSSVCKLVIQAVLFQDCIDKATYTTPTASETKQTLKECLLKCEKLNVEILGVPLLDPQELKTSECNDAIAELLFEYFCTNVSKIKQIHFLGSENATSDMVDPIQRQIVKTGIIETAF